MPAVPTVSRREFIALGASAAAVLPFARGLPGRTARATPSGDLFALGVSSGDPDERSVVLWTRLAGPGLARSEASDAVPVVWELAASESFDEVTASGEVAALAAEGHSVHVVVELAEPSWYRFRSGDAVSPVGRAAPTPSDPTELRIAAASCQHFESGYYAAHRDIAEWSPDLVAFLGDFIYEYAGRPVGGEVVRSVEGGEVRTIDEYRDRYAQYLGDSDLRAARAACPWIVIWDDHEVENNYASIAPERLDDMPAFAGRRLAAYQAWWEHMPVRFDRPATLDDVAIYRAIGWGELAELIMLDGRTYRTNQACNDVTLSLAPPCAAATEPSRTMLGEEQERWLADELATSTAVWPVIGQQTVVTDITLNGAVLNYDQWDGYQPARNRLLESAKAAARTIVLTGDIHLAGVGRLPGVGIEFVTAGISSSNDIPTELEGVVSTLGDVQAAELSHRGYTRHVVTPDTWTAEYRIVDDIADPASPVSTWKSFVVNVDERDRVDEM